MKVAMSETVLAADRSVYAVRLHGLENGRSESCPGRNQRWTHPACEFWKMPLVIARLLPPSI